MNRYLNPFLLFISFLAYCYTATWKFEFIQETSTDYPIPVKNVVKLFKGKYSGIFVNMTIIGTETPKNIKGKLQLVDQSVYHTALESYSFDTRDSTFRMIEIGVPCGIADGVETKIQFTSDNAETEIEPITISYSTGTGPYDIDFIQYNKKLPKHTYGVLYDVLTINNVDSFDVSFESKDTDQIAMIDPIKVPKYNGVPLSQTIKTKYYFKENTEPQPKKKYSFTVKISSACFKSEVETISFEYEDYMIPSPASLLNTITKTATQTIINMPGSISIDMTIEQVPLVSYCAIANGFLDKDLTQQDIIDQILPESVNLQFSFNYYEKPGKTQFLFFGLSEFVAYTLHCIFESISTIDQKREYITFGYLTNTKVTIPLFPEPTISVPAQCLTWKVNKLNEDVGKTFSSRAVTYCYDFLTDHKFPRTQNGCLDCRSANAYNTYPYNENEDSLVTVCMKSSSSCQTNYRGNITEKALELRKKLETGPLIAKELELTVDNLIVKEIYFDNDNEAPDINQIKLEDFNLVEKKAVFKLYTTENKKIKCDTVIGDLSTLGVISYDYTKNYLISKDNTTQYEYDLNSFNWFGQPLNLIVQCYNLPFFIFATRKTEVTMMKQFKLFSSNSTVEPVIVPVDCTDIKNYYNIQCIEIEHSLFYTLETGDPREQNDYLIQQYYTLEHTKQITELAGKILLLNQALDLSAKFNLIISINYLLGVTKCREFLDYNNCRRSKQNFQKDIIEYLQSILGHSSIVDTLSSGFSEQQYERHIILALESLFFMIDNSDTFNPDTASDLISIMQNIKNHLFNLKARTTNKAIHRDITRLISSYLSIFSDVITFNEYDGMYDAKINKTTDFMDVKEIKDYLRIHTEMGIELLQVGIMELTLEEHQYRSFNLKDTNTKRSEIRLDNGWLIEYPREYLVNNFDATYITFTIFKQYYPLRSIKSQDGYHSAAVSIHVYRQNYTKIEVKNLPPDNQFKMSMASFLEDKIHCYYYNYSSNQFANDGLNTTVSDKNPVVCYSDHLTDFVFLVAKPFVPIPTKGGLTWWMIVLIAVGCLVIISLIGIIVYRCMNKSEVDSQLNAIKEGGPMALMSPTED